MYFIYACDFEMQILVSFSPDVNECIYLKSWVHRDYTFWFRMQFRDIEERWISHETSIIVMEFISADANRTNNETHICTQSTRYTQTYLTFEDND